MLNKKKKKKKVKEEKVNSPDKKILSMEVPMPPSVNRLYIQTGKRGGKALTSEAKKYREIIKAEVSKHVVSVSNAIKNKDGYGPEIYKLDITLHVPELENPRWFEGKRFEKGTHAGELKVKLRFKRIDADNRVKFLQDSFCACVGIDDSLIFCTSVSKRETKKEEPYINVTLFEISREGFLEKKKEPTWLKQSS